MANDEIEMVSTQHSLRETVLDEFIAVIELQYDNLNTILEQLNAYSLTDPDVLSEKPFENGFILRRHNNDQVIQVMEEWLAHIFRYSRRDQLSLNYCLRNKKINLRAVDINIRNSEFSQQLNSGRDPIKTRDLGLLSTISNYLGINSSSAQLHNKEQIIQTLNTRLDEKEQIIESLRANLLEIYSSRSWRLVGVLQKLRVLLIPRNSTREKMAKKLLDLFKEYS